MDRVPQAKTFDAIDGDVAEDSRGWSRCAVCTDGGGLCQAVSRAPAAEWKTWLPTCHGVTAAFTDKVVRPGLVPLNGKTFSRRL